jgi:hypothetical protein
MIQPGRAGFPRKENDHERIAPHVLRATADGLPWRAQAADADDFVAANRSQQAQLLEQWAAAPEAPRLPLLRALKSETLR